VASRRAPKTGRQAGEESNAVSTINRIRERRIAKREARAIDRAWHSAATQAMRDEIAIFAQRRPI
jgi:hypothetical protein